MCQFNEAIRDISDIVSGRPGLSGDLKGTGKCSAGRGGSGRTGVSGCRHVCAGSKNSKLLKTKINNVNCKDVKEDKHQSVGDSFQIRAV